MTYIVGAILLLLLIALVLVFRPPKPKSYQDSAYRDDGTKAADDPLGLDIESSREEPVGAEEELTFDDTVETVSSWTGRQVDEEELDLAFDGASSGVAESEHVEEFDLLLEEEGDELSVESRPAADVSSTDTTEESLSVTEELGSDEFDEDIPFIDEGEDAFDRRGKMEVAPALADVPDDYAELEEDETPDELAERLEYFLGTDDDEKEPEPEELIAEHVDDTAVVEEPEAVEETVEVEPLEPEPVIKAEPEASPEGYSADLQEQEERLRHAMNTAIEKRETGQLGLLAVALENLCAKQADIQTSFQQQQKLYEELDALMTEVQQALPGFQLETARRSLREGEHEVVRTLLGEAANQLEGSPQLGARVLYKWGQIEEERGELAVALEMFTKARSGDEDNPDYLYAAGRLARITGDIDNALEWLEKRVSSGQEKGEESVGLARAEYELAKVLVLSEENDRAGQLLLHAREEIEKLLGSDHPDLGPVLHDLALLQERAARYEQAEPLYKQALEVTEHGLGKDNPRLGATLNKLAGLYEELEMEEKSAPLYARALAMKQRVLGENHPDVGTIMGHLANQLKMKGKYDQAEPMYRKSLEIAEAALGKDHPNLAVVLNDMAELYSEMGNEKEAEHFQERAFSLFGLPGMGDGFVEMEKDTDHDVDDNQDQNVAGS